MGGSTKSKHIRFIIIILLLQILKKYWTYTVYFLNHLKTFSSRSSSRYRNRWIRLTVQSYRAIKGSLDSASVPAAFLSPEFIVKEIKAAPGPDCELEATGIWYSREMPSLETLYIMAKEWDMELLSRRFFLYYSTKMRISKLVLKTYQICKKKSHRSQVSFSQNSLKMYL